MSKTKLMVVTVGIITGIIGILTGCAELLNGSLLVDGHNIIALPVDWPNQEFHSKMQGAPVVSLLTGIPFYVLGLLSIAVSVTLIVCCISVVEISRFGILVFGLLNVAVVCFGASKSIPVLEGLPATIVAILALSMKGRARSETSKRKILAAFHLFYWWNIGSWLLFFPGIFVLSFYRSVPDVLFFFMGFSMPVATLGALVSALIFDKSVSNDHDVQRV